MPRPEWSFFMLPEDHNEVKWALSYIQAKLTVWGQIIFSTLLIGMAVSAVGTQTSAYYFVSFVWALFLTSLVLTTFYKPKINVTRDFPPSPTAGGIMMYRVTITNTSSNVLRNLMLFDHRLPYGIYTSTHHPQAITSIDWLGPSEKAVFTIALRTPRRGTFVLRPLLLGTSFPSGLMRALYRSTGQFTLTVFPKLIDIDAPIFLRPSQSSLGNSNIRSAHGGSNEFLSTREYREGDRPRDIHWNSSARLGKLIVKEYAHENFARVGLVLDTELKRFEKHRCFEMLISVCGGVAKRLHQQHYSIDLFLTEPRVPCVSIHGNHDTFHSILKFLSAIEGGERSDFSQPFTLMKERAAGMAAVLVLLRDWDNPRSNFIRELRELNIPIDVIIIRDTPLSLPASGSNITVYTSKQLGLTP